MRVDTVIVGKHLDPNRNIVRILQQSSECVRIVTLVDNVHYIIPVVIHEFLHGILVKAVVDTT